MEAGLTPVRPARRRLVTRAVSDGVRLGLMVAPIDDSVEILKSLKAIWFAPRRAWMFVVNEAAAGLADRIRQAFASRPLIDLDALEQDLARALDTPVDGFFAEALDVQLFPLDAGGFALCSHFDALLVDTMRTLEGRYHRHAGAWVLSASCKSILAMLERKARIGEQHVYVHDTRLRLEDLKAKPKTALPIHVPCAGGSTETEPPLPDPLKTGRGFLSASVSPICRFPVDEQRLARAAEHCGLYDYQVSGVRHLIARSGALLGDDMGLGKSRQAVVASRMSAGTGRILIVCPASLRINWTREIQGIFPKDLVGLVGQDRPDLLRACRWVIASYDRLALLVKVPELRFEVMTVDEAHCLKEHQAGRTRHAFVLAQRIPRRFLLTGTPILNREVEVHTLLRLSGHPVGELTLEAFRSQYCGDAQRRADLAAVLSDWMLRRPKTVLKGLGLKTRQVRYVEPSEGLEQYQRIWNDPLMAVMPKIVKLRQLLEAMKLDAIMDTITALGDDDKVIVFCEYMESVAALKSALAASRIECVSLVGSDSMIKRQRAVDRFQRDVQCRVFIGTTSAAGVGITLTAANYVLFASLPWTPAMMRQAEDRAYRNGQQRDVIVVTLIVPATIDEHVQHLLANKTEIEADVVERAVADRLASRARSVRLAGEHERAPRLSQNPLGANA